MRQTERPTGEPTAEELQMADAFARLRLSVTDTWSVGVGRLIDEALRELCRMVWRLTGGRVTASTFRLDMTRAMEMEAAAILFQLEMDIKSLLASGLETLSEEEVDAEQQSALLEDLTDLVTTMGKETEARLAVYFYHGLTSEQMEQRLVEMKRNPWKGDGLWLPALLALHDIAQSDLLREGVKSSTGKSNVSFNQIRLYGETQLQEAANRGMLEAYDSPQWFCSLTADDTACENCKEMERAGWQPIETYAGYWHPYCRCRFVFR